MSARLPSLGAEVPQRWAGWARVFARGLMGALGWRVHGHFPNVPKAVIIGAPHTSNTDGFIGLTLLVALGLDAKTFIKDSAFVGPLGWLLRRLGALPIRRGKGAGMVEQSIAALRSNERLWLLVAPEGTRKAATKWKLGFHHIAHGAEVPVVIAVIDYRNKVVTILPPRAAGPDAEAEVVGWIEEMALHARARHPARLSAPMAAAMARLPRGDEP